ncbi:SIS domain-containing protein, partial [Candidatus Micrarchaeota archaeon]|nr:SIS domain-containing protein [Candidatus Micrarchaeota archaeon]
MDMNSSRTELVSALEGIDSLKLQELADAIICAFKSGNKILIAGNGGSASDSQHFAAELVCTFNNKKRKALPAIALTTNTSILTAWGNDFSFDSVFERQVEALGQKGDVLFSITTSG